MNQPLMTHATETIEAGSKSFATAARLFDPQTRRGALMLYAWCRHCDDVIDGQALGFAVPTPTADQRFPAPASVTTPELRLQELRQQTARAFEGAPMSEPAFAAFQEVAMAQEIPARLAFDHLEGYAMDVREESYLTFDDTLRYCYHVAGVVGLMMAQVMGVRDQAVLDRACDLGLAFQLTNIARDIVEDAQVGRCYVPQAWLTAENLTLDNYVEPSQRGALARVAQRLIEEAEPYYHSAQAGLHGLPLRSAWAIATARGVYREIGVKVRNAGQDAWQQRQGTSKAEKIGLLLAGAGQAIASRRVKASPRPADLWQRPR
jgi:phytoene synthase